MPYLGVRPADITSATEAEIAGDLTVNTNNLKVDATTGRVGVGTASPQNLAHFKGTSSGENILHLDNSAGSGHGDTNNNVRVVSGNNGYWANLVIAGQQLEFKVQGGTSMLRVDSDGVKFNGDTAAANALDDYEEGTWTVTNKSVASLSITNTQTAYYVKIGRLVFFNFYATYPTTSDSNTAKLSLPFASGVSTSQGHSYVTGRFQGTASNGIVGQITNGTDEMLFASNTSSTAFFTNANFSGKYLLMSGCYRASA